jgi:hypothetical protein
MTQSYGGAELPPAPRAPQWRDQTPRRGPVPPSVQNAVRLMLVRSAVSVVSIIVVFTTRADLEQRIRAKTPNATDSTIHRALAVAAVTSIVILVFYVFLAFQVHRGANWARIVTWVIAGLGILGALLSLGQPDPPISRILGVLVALIDIAVVILLATGDSNRYFKPRY